MFVRKSTYEQLYANHTKLINDHSDLTRKYETMNVNHQALLKKFHELQKPLENHTKKTTIKLSKSSAQKKKSKGE